MAGRGLKRVRRVMLSGKVGMCTFLPLSDNPHRAFCFLAMPRNTRVRLSVVTFLNPRGMEAGRQGFQIGVKVTHRLDPLSLGRDKAFRVGILNVVTLLVCLGNIILATAWAVPLSAWQSIGWRRFSCQSNS